MNISDDAPSDITQGGRDTSRRIPQWRLRRRLVVGVTRYLMWGLPVLILLDLIFGRDFVHSLGVPALTGIIGLPGGYLVGRSVQTAIRERQSIP